MKSLTFVSLLASLAPLALAQSTTSNSNTLIPSGISTACNAFYVQLNANATLTACLNPLIEATSQFSNPSSTISTSAINSALNNICSTSNICPSALINAQLALFYAACQPELTSSSKVPAVVATYDVLYAFPLFQQSLCQKDDTGKYCVVNVTSPSSSTKRSSSLDSRDDSQASFTSTLTTYGQKDLCFLGLSPNMTAPQLCTQCTRDVMNIFTQQLNSMPYGPGIDSSYLLSGQPALYAAINKECGTSFLSGQVQAAGALSTGAAPRAADASFAFIGSAIAALAAGVVAVL
ncbi:hypothetical protein V8E53_005620 [Lactarius tabidus]